MKKISIGLTGLSLLLLPVLALCVATPAEINPKTELPTEESAVWTIVNRAINWLFAILLVGAAIMIVIAAYTFLSSAGDADKTKSARNYIVYALVAIVVGFLAKAVVVLLMNMLGYVPLPL